MPLSVVMEGQLEREQQPQRRRELKGRLRLLYTEVVSAYGRLGYPGAQQRALDKGSVDEAKAAAARLAELCIESP